MHRLGTERQFGNILEAARSEKDWKNVRAYLNMFNEYSIHLNHKQKRQTLSFLYELLLNKEGDIRRQAATLMGKIFADFNAGYRKELPKGFGGEEVRYLLDETCIAELIHGLLCVAGLHCMDYWPGAGGMIFAVLYLVGNLLFVCIQRHNRPRLVRVYERICKDAYCRRIKENGIQYCKKET